MVTGVPLGQPSELGLTQLKTLVRYYRG